MPNPVTIVEGATTIVKSAHEVTQGKITIHADMQSKRGRRTVETCECPNVQRYTRKCLRTVRRTFLSSLFRDTAVRMVIGIRWQGNGCDITGATPYLSSESSAGYGTSVDVTITAVTNDQTRPQQQCECCRGASCVEFAVQVSISPLLGQNVIMSGYIIVCANGEVGAEWN